MRLRYALAKGICVMCIQLLFISSGCGPERTLPEPRMVVEEDAPPRVAPPQPSAEARTAAASQPAVNTPNSGPPATTDETPSLLPSNVQEWSDDDFLTARAEGDPRVVQAVAHRIRKSGADDAATVALFTRLIESEGGTSSELPQATDGSSTVSTVQKRIGRQVVSRQGAEITTLVIPYLAQSVCPQAERLLERLLRGEVKCDLRPAQLVDVALKALAADPQRHDALFFRLLTQEAPAEAVPAGMSTHLSMQRQCLTILQTAASPNLRLRLAQHIVRPDTPPASRELLGSLLAAPDARNLAAHIVLHDSGLLSPEKTAEFRGRFAAINALLLDYLLEISASLPTAGAGFAPVASSRDSVFRSGPQHSDAQSAGELAALFWSPTFLDRIACDLERMSDIGRDVELMRLACNLPSQQVRRRLHQAMMRQWAEGAEPFKAARLTFDAIRDPGFLLLAKSMPRREPPRSNTRNRFSPSQVGEQHQARYAWMAAVESFIRSLNGRFFGAGLARRNCAPSPPCQFHRGAEVAVQFHAKWPHDVRAKLPGSDAEPLEVYYARLQSEDRLSRVADFYRRQFSGASRKTPSGIWVDCLERLPEKNTLRSVDVMITSETPLRRTAPDLQPLTVELLWVEILDPTEPEAAAVGQDSAQNKSS